jgi:cobalamin biosynthesis protein CobW
MTALAKTPCTILTGFLGAGKTTLVRHLLTNAGGRRLAVIVNEFGDIGIDGAILKDCGIADCPEDRIVELTNGCLCCTVADDFVPALEALLDRPDPPEAILIETSGLALPKPLVKAFGWPSISGRVTVDGVVAVVDAEAVAAGRFAPDLAALAAQRAADPSLDHDFPLQEVYEDQLACADLVVVNKTDLLDAAAAERLAAGIAAGLSRAVKVVRTAEGRVDPHVLLGLDAAAEDDLAARPSHHDSEGEHDHDDFESFIVELGPQPAPEALVDRLRAVAADHAILRIKGHVAITDRPLRLLVQGVGARFRHQFERPWPAGADRVGRLVVIGERGLDRAAIGAAIAG